MAQGLFSHGYRPAAYLHATSKYNDQVTVKPLSKVFLAYAQACALKCPAHQWIKRCAVATNALMRPTLYEMQVQLLCCDQHKHHTFPRPGV